jgi:CDP-diacylglycerol--glycerol-3-phosphate 3-phosphatidyltransferase
MCHPWLAAGVTVFVGAILVRELSPLVGTQSSGGTTRPTGLLGTSLRTWFRKRIAPVAESLMARRIPADAVTLTQLAASLICGVAYAYGWMFTAGWLLFATGTLDVIDGEMARRQGCAGPRGAFIDSVVDRYGESAVFVGLVVFYRDAWMLWAVLGAWAGAFLVSYARARAESLGIECPEGMLQRPERFVILGGSSMASAVAAQWSCTGTQHRGVLAAGLCVLAVLAHATALQRTRQTLRKLG